MMAFIMTRKTNLDSKTIFSSCDGNKMDESVAWRNDCFQESGIISLIHNYPRPPYPPWAHAVDAAAESWFMGRKGGFFWDQTRWWKAFHIYSEFYTYRPWYSNTATRLISRTWMKWSTLFLEAGESRAYIETIISQKSRTFSHACACLAWVLPTGLREKWRKWLANNLHCAPAAGRIDWCCFRNFVTYSLVTLLEALCARLAWA